MPSAAERVIVQYNKMEFNRAEFGPFPAKVSGNRVTDENVPVKVLAAGAPVVQLPEQDRAGGMGRLGAGARPVFPGREGREVRGPRVDDGFVQGQSGREARVAGGGEASARVGGSIVGLGLWRQLPAGTDGAYQLLANLISLSKAH